ncbi:MAG TPA: EamA family transporter [Blastocatellia bacterium]|nr:EamA family transporter [Blastocatellia bacterium]
MPPPDKLHIHDKTPYLHMLWASMAFATTAAFSHRAGELCDWRLVVAARGVVTFFFAAIIAKAGGVKFVWRDSATLWIRSVASGVGMVCGFYALTHLPVSDTLTLINTSPIWVTLLSWLIFGQRPTVGVICAVIVSVTGIALIQQPHFQSGKFAGLIALCAAFCVSVSMLGLGRLKHIDPRAIAAHFSGVASVAAILLLLLTDRKDYSDQLGNKSVLLLLTLVGAGGALGQIGMTRAFAKGHASRVSVIALSQILFGLGFDVLFWSRSVNLISLLGMALVIAPTAWLILGKASQQRRDLIKVEMED